MQELIVIDDLLSALVGIEGRYISINRVGGNDNSIMFNVDGSMVLALQVKNIHIYNYTYIDAHIYVSITSWNSFHFWEINVARKCRNHRKEYSLYARAI